MKNRDIVIVALQSWDFEIGSNARNIAREFARHNRVIYVNPPLDRITSIRKKDEPRTKRFLDVIAGKSEALVNVEPNIWNLTPSFVAESANWIPSPKIYDWINRRNNQKFADDIQKAVAQLNFKDVLLFNDNFMFGAFYLKEMLKPSAYVYYIRDYLLVQPYFKRHGERLEPALARKSDAVVANSTYLQEYAAKYNPNSFYVGQGCEVDMFDEAKWTGIPEDIRSIKKPMIGYVGFLTAKRLDIDLLVGIAEQRPDWSIVLVGPEDEVFAESKLHQLSNVHFPGRKRPDELPAYVGAFDVCINPQAINQLTIGNYPRKIDEYLAMGKPTVATATKAMEIFAETTYLATDIESYIKQISLALNDKDPVLKTKRIELSRSHTWENSVNDIYQAIQKVTKPA